MQDNSGEIEWDIAILWQLQDLYGCYRVYVLLFVKIALHGFYRASLCEGVTVPYNNDNDNWFLCTCSAFPIKIKALMIKGSITHYIYLTMVESVLYRGGCGYGWIGLSPGHFVGPSPVCTWASSRSLGPYFCELPVAGPQVLVIYFISCIVSCCFYYCYYLLLYLFFLFFPSSYFDWLPWFITDLLYTVL